MGAFWRLLRRFCGSFCRRFQVGFVENGLIWGLISWWCGAAETGLFMVGLGLEDGGEMERKGEMRVWRLCLVLRRGSAGFRRRSLE